MHGARRPAGEGVGAEALTALAPVVAADHQIALDDEHLLVAGTEFGHAVRKREGADAGEVATGLLYLDPLPRDLHEGLNTVATPLNSLPDEALVPGPDVLAKINAGLR